MAKPTKYATPICVALSLVTVVGVLLGLKFRLPLLIAGLLLPAVLYEIYRTEGESTIWASWLTLFAIIAELAAVWFNLKFDLAAFLGVSSHYVGGYYVPLGDIKVIFPTIMAVLAAILFFRTAGIYTKWLAVLIFIGAFSIIYTVDPALFQNLIKVVIRQGLNRLGYY